jgi:hypothetical protein
MGRDRRVGALPMTGGSVPVIDGYTDFELIGRGGVGDVYRAVRRATGTTVAVKVLRDVTDESTAWRRCRRELTALLSLGGDPHVIGLVEVVAADDCPALVMEYAPGGSVADELARRGGPLAPGDVVRIGRDAAAALVAAHARGIVHRDVKPHNLLFAADATVKLCDFGIAALARSPEFRHATASVSLRFASPEDLETDGVVGPPADVYSLGATLLYLARGEHLELRDRLRPWQPPGGPDEPTLAALDAVLADCLQPAPETRPQAVDVFHRLVEIAEGADHAGPVDPADDIGTLPRPLPGYEPPVPAAIRRPSPGHPRPHRRRASVAAGLLLAGVLVGVVGWRLVRGPAAPVIRPAVAAELVARPSGLVALTAAAWPVGPIGECLRQQPGSPALQPVGCDEPHDLERVGLGALGPAAGTEFDAAQVDAEVDRRCAAATREFAGAAPAGLGLAVAVTRPSAGGWAAGDRAYRCYVGAPDRRVTGTAATGATHSG